MIRKARQERNLTQEQLGKLIGVQKAQISKLESSANSATIGSILKVFKALSQTAAIANSDHATPPL
jgi:HTH-type transcriptional regulator / antitoxin HipB